jgi:ribosomal protein L37AE/L43A
VSTSTPQLDKSENSMIIPIPNLHECPICQARADQIENHRVFWYCNSCACEFEIKADGRIGRKLPTPHVYATDISGNVMTDP